MSTTILPKDVYDTLKAIGSEDRPTMNTLISLYCERTPEMIATIKLSASQKEVIELQNAVHAYKGVCMNLGFTPLGDICHDIEKAVTLKDFLRINALCTQLEETHNEIDSQLNILIHSK